MADGGEALILEGKVIVANTGEDTLSCIDLKTRKVTRTINLKNIINKNKKVKLSGSFIGPYDMVSNNQRLIYCTNVYDNSIFKVDIEKDTILNSLYVGSCPTSIKYFQNYLFTANSDSNSISVIDENTFSLIENIPVGEKPIDIEIDEFNMKMYVANSQGQSLNVVGLNNKENQTIYLDNNPVKIIVEEDICILSIINNGITSNSNISIMNKKTNKIEESLNFKGIFNTVIKINGNEIVFITNIDNGYLYRVNIKKGRVLNKIHLKGMPNKLEWNGDKILFISNVLSNTLTLFNINSNEVIDNIKVGIEPNGILVFD